MTIYGGAEVQWYQVTPIGLQRLQTGQYRHLDLAEQQILREIASLGGTAEWDELKMYGTYDSPQILAVALRRLIDMGYVAPVTMQKTQEVM